MAHEINQPDDNGVGESKPKQALTRLVIKKKVSMELYFL